MHKNAAPAAARGFSTPRLRIRVNQVPPVTVVHARVHLRGMYIKFRSIPVIPFPCSDCREPAPRYARALSFHTIHHDAATRQLRSSGTQQTRRAGSYSTRRSASPHAAGLRSYRRSAAQVVDARGHHPSVFGSMRDWGGNHGSGPRTQRKPPRGDRHKFSPPRPRGPRPSFRALCSNQLR